MGAAALRALGIPAAVLGQPELDPAVHAMRVDGIKGDGNFFYLPFLSFVPRIGFAWDVTGNGKMAIRSSFGIFNNLLNLGGQAGESGVARL